VKKRRDSLATPREFVRAWQESSYLREVARKVGSTKGACSRRATRYREMGVPLKLMAPIVPAEPTDWDELAQFARELAPPDDGGDDTGDDESGTEISDQLSPDQVEFGGATST